MMKLLKLFTAGLFLTVLAVGCQQQTEEVQVTQRSEINDYTKAVAVIHPTEGNKATGTVTFEKKADGVQVHAEIEGLSAGNHGFHIHQYGDCSVSDGTSAGGHYNPQNKEHGAPTDSVRHVGDMGNLSATAEGTATLDYTDPVISLSGPESVIGHAIIIHGGEDDLTSQPTGKAGPRLGCGVIGIANTEMDSTAQQ